MSDYPAGAEHDSRAPYNEPIDVLKCLECGTQLEIGDYCNECSDYLEREKQKKKAIEKCQGLKHMFETSTHNVYAANKLGEIIKEINNIM